MFKIFVVEDDKDLNRTMCSFLGRSGFEAVGALNANEAYDEMYGQMFDLIVLKKQREKTAPKILALAEEVSNLH